MKFQEGVIFIILILCIQKNSDVLNNETDAEAKIFRVSHKARVVGEWKVRLQLE